MNLELTLKLVTEYREGELNSRVSKRAVSQWWEQAAATGVRPAGLEVPHSTIYEGGVVTVECLVKVAR